jgi:cell division septation protein DedD
LQNKFQLYVGDIKMSLETEIKKLTLAIVTLTEALGKREGLVVQAEDLVIEPEPTPEPTPEAIEPEAIEPEAIEPEAIAPEAIEPTPEPTPAPKVEEELSHKSVQEYAIQISRLGVPASHIKAAVKDVGADKIAGVATERLQDLKDALDNLAEKHK